MANETWYQMEDGSVGNPREIVPDKDGVLVHKDGRKVAYSEHGPRSRSVDPQSQEKKPKKEKLEDELDLRPPAPKTREAKPTEEEPKSGYKTRETKTK